MFSKSVYPSWKAKQEEKYGDILKALTANDIRLHGSMLDIGIGDGWFEDFLAKGGIRLDRIVGVEPEDNIKHLPNVGYAFARRFETDERFDIVVCIDALHLVDYDITHFAKPGGVIIACVPLSFAGALEKLNKTKPIIKQEIGTQERDVLLVAKK